MAINRSAFLRVVFSACLSCLILSSSALPVKRQVDTSESTVDALLGGLFILKEVSDPVADNSRELKSFLKTHIGNNTGATVLCDLLPIQELVPECWRRELELFCFQWNLRAMLHRAFFLMNPNGITPDYVQWIKNQLADVADSAEKDYVCSNYFALASRQYTSCKDLPGFSETM